MRNLYARQRFANSMGLGEKAGGVDCRKKLGGDKGRAALVFCALHGFRSPH